MEKQDGVARSLVALTLNSSSSVSVFATFSSSSVICLVLLWLVSSNFMNSFLRVLTVS